MLINYVFYEFFLPICCLDQTTDARHPYKHIYFCKWVVYKRNFQKTGLNVTLLNTHHSRVRAIESRRWQRICGSGERSGPAQSRGKASRTYRCPSGTAGGRMWDWGTRGRRRTDPGSVRRTSLRHRPLSRGRSRSTSGKNFEKWQKFTRSTAENV